MILDTVRYSDMQKPRAKPVYLVEKIVTERTISIWYGYPGSKKSLVVADLCMAIATGSNFLPSMPGAKIPFVGFATKKTPVLFLDYENGEDLSYERFNAFGKVYQADPAINLFYACLPKLSIVNYKSITELIKEIQAMPILPGVIVIDTLLRFAKVQDENSSAMDGIMAMARRLVDELQVTIILISHSNKILGSRAGNALRGHSSIEGGADYVFRVNSDRDTDIVSIINEKSRRNPIDPFSARWTYKSDPTNDQLIEARLYHEPYQDTASLATQKKNALNARIEKEILSTLNSLGAMSKAQLFAQVGGSRQKVWDAIEKLDNFMAIEITKAGQAWKCEITPKGKGLLP